MVIPYPCFSELSVDDEDDGSIDKVGYEGWDEVSNLPLGGMSDQDMDSEYEIAWSYSYDTQGRLVSYMLDDLFNGYTETYSYDANGYIASDQIDYSNDGSIDLDYSYVHDADGNLTHLEYDYDGDGIDELTWDYVYVEGVRISATVDFDDDGIADGSCAYQSDDVPRFTRIDCDYVDYSSFSITTEYTDPVLDVGTDSYDYDADGIVDATSDFSYDASHQQTYFAHDQNADGIIESEYVLAYDADGNLTSYDWFLSESYYYGYGSEVIGAIDYGYDTRGRQISEHTEETKFGDTFTSTSTWLFGGTCP